MSGYLVYPAIAVAAAVAFALGWVAQRRRNERLNGAAQQMRARILDEADREARTLRKAATLEVKEEAHRTRQEFERETERVRQEMGRRSEALDQRENNLTRKVAFLDQKEARLERMEEELKQLRTELALERAQAAELIREQTRRLEHIAGLSAERARAMLVESQIAEARAVAARSVKEAREEAERTAKREAQTILSLAIQRYAAEHVAEGSVAVVDLPSDDMKGRIIGREGRNIRAFELATGVDVIIDDTPEAVIISGFDPVRREVACQALQKLIKDGRIHPGRIEEIVARTRQDMQEKIRELGEQACLEMGLQSVNPELVPLVGRLHYRTSYGQNLLLHSKEVGTIAGIIAAELGLDAKLARRCGFLHDIGKAADHELEGPHALIGARLCKKLGEPETVINAVGGHHQDLEAISPYTFITAAADAVSASRPGARRESLESYIKRLESLEQIADSFEGVDKSYAIQAGREIRILVNHTKVSDVDAATLAEDISKRIEGELEYPGQIKVMVIRETRAVAYAR